MQQILVGGVAEGLLLVVRAGAGAEGVVVRCGAVVRHLAALAASHEAVVLLLLLQQRLHCGVHVVAAGAHVLA